jgi:hypothetical protein
MDFYDLHRFCITLPCFHLYEKCKVLNDTITLEFVHELLVKNSKTQLNWAAYALTAHEKHNDLQIMRQVAKEKKTLETNFIGTSFWCYTTYNKTIECSC